jgi:chromosome segregation protein
LFLRSLTIKGFKSFARKTVLEFEPGVTIIVGPTGPVRATSPTR